MRQKWERRDILLLFILIALCVDIIMRLPLTKSIADTFELDKCITMTAKEKPGGYVHVIPHPSEN